VENPLAAPGQLETKIYTEYYPRQAVQYDAALAHHRSLPAVEVTNGRQVLDGVTGKIMDNAGGHGSIYSNIGSDTGWRGVVANTVLGYSMMVDFGSDVEVGYALLRVAHGTPESRTLNTNTSCGMRAAIYKANSSGGTPLGSLTKSGVGNGTSGLAFSSPTMTLNVTGTPFVAGDVGKYIVVTGASAAANNGAFLITAFNSASSISYTNASGSAQAGYASTWYVTPTANVRTTGTTNYNHTLDVENSTALSSGDFLGPITLTPTTPAVGQIVSGASTFADTTNAQFVAGHVGQVLKITAGAGADIGSYRIIGYTSSSVVTVRNLDQTAKQWTVSSATVTYEIRDGVREEDMIVVANGGHRLCVERLLTANTLQVRTPPAGTITAQSWICVKPSWDIVKKISYSTEAQPPDVANNRTWGATDGRERYDFSDAKFYMDFSDLPTAARSGRYWKWTGIPRFASDGSRADHWPSTWEFYDIAGNRLTTSKYSLVDEARTNADFLFTNANRVDFIQAANDVDLWYAGFNGNVNLGGANGDTLTLTTASNKFIGFQIGHNLIDDLELPVGTNILNSASAVWPANATVGRFIHIASGTYTETWYRIASRPSATQVTVVTPSGSAVSWSGTETGVLGGLHEGINAGGTNPDKFVFLEDQREFTIISINDACDTITIAETGQPARTNKTWEIRRPGYDTASATTEAGKGSRLVRPGTTYPLQTGDVCVDSRGATQIFGEDIGTGFEFAGGATSGGNTVTTTNNKFTKSHVGRLMYIMTGVNKGIYEISAVASPSSLTVINHYTGGAVTLTADAGLTYRIYGDRRFRLTRFVVGLRA
jgi:hypothetical protein